MADTEDPGSRRAHLAGRYRQVRALTEALAAPLSAEDQTVQTMPEVSPTKWHRGHTSWFFETFLLQPALDGYRDCHPAYGYIFNSYYEAVGARHPRAERGQISRPGAEEVGHYRAHVDRAMDRLLAGDLAPDTLDLVELGLNHEQQHQELLLMDIKHVLSKNPLQPAYLPDATAGAGDQSEVTKPGWTEHQGGIVQAGHPGGRFGYDNEFPRHDILLAPFALADLTVTCGEWLAFMDDGGYDRPELWLSDGWALVQAERRAAPLYWSEEGPGSWEVFGLAGRRSVDPVEPAGHLDYYEADAFARWSGARLPTEIEWEAVAAGSPVDGNLLDPSAPATGGPIAGAPHPIGSTGGSRQLFGDVWEWTRSAYDAYPGFRPAAGAVGEYNGKFMVNQYVLRGGSCATPADHIRPTYRNFFPAGARWAFSGLRLARDL
ncbi:MAG TPA: ergothioneine biosynthesis protein EgtB [Acidimicrobiales bacterium]|jgi:ergothioneine biosynthesis protein EgtB|nr:ergothioneine biosynthesis protein EgtB [Acidimicrobiales bacterium]